MNLSLNPLQKYKGPPKNIIFPSILLPCASPPIVWFTTDWNTLAEISSFLAPWFNRGCISVLAKTPHLEAISYIFSCLRLKLSISSTVSPIRWAIWSMKAPVPPAQLEFILSSKPPVKKIILASSPPSSIATSTSS